MALLHFFESIRQPWLDKFMLAVTEFGGETLFMAIAIILYWCYDKTAGYFSLSVGFVGTTLNQFLKLVFRIPRPWVQEEGFTIVEAARADAGGYSFPSGHTQNAAATLGVPALTVKRKALRVVLWVLYLLVPISRMYLGVHTPLDTGVALAMGLALLFLMRPVFRGARENPRRLYALLGGMVGLAVLYVLYVELCPFPEDIDANNLHDGTKAAYMLLGAVSGMLLACWIDQRFVKFSVEGSLPAQIVKCVVGLGLTIALRMALKSPLHALLGEKAGDAVRYGIMVIFAAAVWPMAFPFICRVLPKKRA